jgi:protein TonB
MTKATRATGMAVSVLALLAGVLITEPLDLRAQAPQMPRDRGAAPPAQNGEEARLQQLLATDPANVHALQALAALHHRSGRFDQAIQSLERVAALRPADPGAHHVVGTSYLEKTKDLTLTPAARRTLVERGLAAENQALAIDSEYLEALVYKNLLLRMKAQTEPDPAARQALLREADALRGKALQLAASRAAAPVPSGTVVPVGSMPAPPPPPPPPGAPPASEMNWSYATTDYTAVSGPRPEKTRDVRPIYPPMALWNGIEGTVILEAMVDPGGRVSQVQVVQSQPLLTQSTIDAVRKWEFESGTGGAARVISITADFKKSK